MSETANNDNLELEEGEIAGDSDDNCSITNHNDIADASKEIVGCDATDEPPKKKKKTKLVKRKVKVKKKVIRKKGGGAGGSGGGPGGGGGGGAGHNANNNSNNNNNDGQNNAQHQKLLPHTTSQHQTVQHHQTLLPNHSSQHTNILGQQPQNSQQLDSLWEQQILMLQELQRQQDQQHTQLLRAAATDEDLRIFPPNFVPTNNSLGMLSMNSLQTIQHMKAPVTTTSTTTTAIYSTTPALQNIAPTLALTPAPSHSNSQNQTPGSPDDENGKSSYEAISKMLTLLRNSANVSDSSETNETDTVQETNDDSDAKKPISTIEYSLIPVLVEGIDYTKYKLLYKYESKFKNDPRLNQQT